MQQALIALHARRSGEELSRKGSRHPDIASPRGLIVIDVKGDGLDDHLKAAMFFVGKGAGGLDQELGKSEAGEARCGVPAVVLDVLHAEVVVGGCYAFVARLGGEEFWGKDVSCVLAVMGLFRNIPRKGSRSVSSW